MHRTVVLIAALLAQLPLPAGAGVRTLEGLRAGERADIQYEATRDAALVRHAFRIEGELGSVNVARDDGRSVIVLSEGLVPKLDRLLEYYRTPPTGQCARTETVKVVWTTRAGTETESFVDRSCRAEETCGVLPLPVVAARATGAEAPPSREAELCNLGGLANADRVREAVDAWSGPGGSSRLAAILGEGRLPAAVVAACTPLLLGWLWRRRNRRRTA